MSEADRMMDEAARWVSQMDAGAWTDAQEAALQQWLALHPRHAGALLQAQAAWAVTDPANHVVPEAAAEPEPRFDRRRVIGYGGAALAASIAGGMFLLSKPASFTTAVGEIRRVPLEDGSVAAINTASKVEVAFADSRRSVRVDRGEAWFQVAKDPARPFVVEAGRVRVEAVGTAFSVRRHDKGAEVLVTEGVVEAWASGAEGHRVRVAAGASAFISDDAAIRTEQAAPSTIDRTLAWRSGKIDLVGDRLDQAVAEFNRYNRRQIVILDPAIASEQFDGAFRTDDPEGFALAVRDSLRVPVDLSDPASIRIGASVR